MTYSKDIYETLGSIMGYNWCINFTFKFTKKYLFGKSLAIWTQPAPTLFHLISHDLIYIKKYIYI